MNIAVIGTGISGMLAARLLHSDHDITVFEANDYVGGHTNTLDVMVGGKRYAVDTGFIVFNDATYPNFVRLMRRLNVPRHKSCMSFSVSCERTGLEYSPTTLGSLFVQREKLTDAAFWRMLADIFRFRAVSKRLFNDADYAVELGDFLRENRFSGAFIDKFLMPMGAAIWSADPTAFRRFPARYFAEFFDNHGFLNILRQPQWYVLQGGSRSYVGPLTEPFRDHIRLNTPVRAMRRNADHVEIVTDDATERFDAAVIAAHSDQALAMLADPSDAERAVLGAIPYQPNATLLHTDVSRLPERKGAWASWNYRISRQDDRPATVTYNMNILQGIGRSEPGCGGRFTGEAPVFCVSLNQTDQIAPEKVLASLEYHHPVYTRTGLNAQRRRHEINGVNRTWFCGAYWGYGFHEDGVRSALAVASDFGKDLSDV